ncbi:hypothetical protein NEIELOOT_02538 [Neisseria elongata subsp. glycolytica ATCC 29315]|uniref:Uncharacterized protein n=1 Tax=Neisseria elongata subsp. glycolytica ATCC 29315 TaxID=546263 RepID=D4DTY1_NEIEG|nr:hypothetical protein NEIELOOT_02538 [Neisseria elongata subsp. glycolytica ATCC 29315]
MKICGKSYSQALYTKNCRKIMSMSKTLHIGQVYQSEQSKTGWKKVYA